MSAQENSPKNKEIIQENTGLWSFAEYTVPSGAWNALTGRPTVQRFPAEGAPLHSMVTDKLCPTSRAEPPLLEKRLADTAAHMITRRLAATGIRNGAAGIRI